MAKVQTTLPAQTAAGSTSVTLAGPWEPENYTSDTVDRVEITPPVGYSTVTGVVTNNATFNVRQMRAGSAVATFASLTLASGTNLVAEIPVAVPITAQAVFAANDVIDVQMVQNASGLAVGSGLVLSVFVN